MALDIRDGIWNALTDAGSTDSQVKDGELVLAPLCEMQGSACVLKATGAAIESDKSLTWVRENKPHLLPPVYQVNDADVAFTGRGNKTVAQKLIRELGKTEADKIAQTYGKAHALDNKPGVAPQRKQHKSDNAEHAKNPWSKAGWSVTRQGQLVRSLGVEKASAMARAVSSHIGATRPTI